MIKFEKFTDSPFKGWNNNLISLIGSTKVQAGPTVFKFVWKQENGAASLSRLKPGKTELVSSRCCGATTPPSPPPVGDTTSTVNYAITGIVLTTCQTWSQTPIDSGRTDPPSPYSTGRIPPPPPTPDFENATNYDNSGNRQQTNKLQGDPRFCIHIYWIILLSVCLLVGPLLVGWSVG